MLRMSFTLGVSAEESLTIPSDHHTHLGQLSQVVDDTLSLSDEIEVSGKGLASQRTDALRTDWLQHTDSMIYWSHLPRNSWGRYLCELLQRMLRQGHWGIFEAILCQHLFASLALQIEQQNCSELQIYHAQTCQSGTCWPQHPFWREESAYCLQPREFLPFSRQTIRGLS